MRVLGRTAAIGVLALVGLGMASGQATAATSTSYPPIERTVPAAQEPCTFASSIPPPPVPANQVQAIEKEVMAIVGKHFDGIGQCAHGLLVLTLTPGSEVLAQKVRAKFGPSVQIMVGWTVWNGRPGRSATCGTLAAPTTTPARYSTALDLRSRVIQVGANLKGHVTFHNASTTQGVSVLTDKPIEVVITKPGTRRVVGVLTSPVAGVGYAVGLSPGQSLNIGIVGGTGRCDGGLGSALPPGRYEAVAEVSGVAISGLDGLGGKGPLPTHFTPFVPIQIIR
jgi:hypothetical protein